MPTGRCAGCGWIASSRRVNQHILACKHYLDLFRSSPEQAREPEAEYVRFKTEDSAGEAAKRRDERLRKRFAEMDKIQSFQATRWNVKDILDD